MITLLLLAIYGSLIYVVFCIAGSLLWAVLKVTILFACVAIIWKAITGKRLV